MTKFFLLDLILFLIIGGVAIILQYHFGNRLNKKFEIVYGCISAGIIAVTSIVFAIKMNPIITPSLHADYLEYIKLDRDKSTFKSHRDFSSEKEITFKHF